MMMKRPHLLANERGAAVIELALIAPMLALMTIGIVDMSNAVARKLRLEQAAQRAIEKVMNTTGDTTVEDTIRDEAVCQVNGTKSDGTCKSSPITTANVTVTYRLECNGVVTTDNDCPSDQTANEWIQVNVTDSYEPLFPIKFAGIDSDGTYHLSATAGVRIQ
jgi:Flp pilus assembly protein TadG